MTHMVDDESTAVDKYTLYAVVTQKSVASSLHTTVLIDSRPLDMEVDTGATFSLINEITFNKLWDSDTVPPLQPSGLPLPLRTYTGEPIRVLGSVMVTVNNNQQEAELPLLVVRGDGPSLQLALGNPTRLEENSLNSHTTRTTERFGAAQGCIQA